MADLLITKAEQKAIASVERAKKCPIALVYFLFLEPWLQQKKMRMERHVFWIVLAVSLLMVEILMKMSCVKM